MSKKNRVVPNSFWVLTKICKVIRCMMMHDAKKKLTSNYLIGEFSGSLQLTTMYFVMLPRNHPPESFKQLLDAFRSSQRIHRLIELNLVASANFALGWIRKWHPMLDFSSMSLSLPPGRTKLQVHMDAMLQTARRIIGRLLQEDAIFFREHHYLNPLMVDDSDQPML
jgi:hypothetical protein